jgi:hypothetical protein
LTERGDERSGAIGAAIVDHDDFVDDVVESQLEMEMFYRGGDAALFVASGYDNGEQFDG